MARTWEDSAEQAQFENDLNAARGYKPVTKREFRRAYKQYDKQGLKFGQVKKDQSDEALYERAKGIVLDWWKYQQKQKDRLGKTPGGSRGRRGVDASNPYSGWTDGNMGGSGSGSSGYMLPDTSMSPRGGDRIPDLDPIISRSQQEQRSSANSRDAQSREQRQQRESFDRADARRLLRQMGVPRDWSPPSRALRSEAALTRWVNEAAQRAQVQLRRNAAPILNRQATRTIARNMGYGHVDPRTIPVKYRLSVKALTNYFLTRRAAEKMHRKVARQRQQQQQLERMRNV